MEVKSFWALDRQQKRVGKSELEKIKRMDLFHMGDQVLYGTETNSASF
jgi:hypothetical protein